MCISIALRGVLCTVGAIYLVRRQVDDEGLPAARGQGLCPVDEGRRGIRLQGGRRGFGAGRRRRHRRRVYDHRGLEGTDHRGDAGGGVVLRSCRYREVASEDLHGVATAFRQHRRRLRAVGEGEAEVFVTLILLEEGDEEVLTQIAASPRDEDALLHHSPFAREDALLHHSPFAREVQSR